jgi:RNA recognition motif-containing protein
MYNAARCHALMKEQKKHYIQFHLEFPEMKLLEKSTRTLWIGNLSEWITENQVKEAAKLYGHVMSINIVRTGVTEDARGYKRCFGFIEFSQRKTVEIFLTTSNLMLCGEKITSRPGNVPSQIQQKCLDAGYIFETSNQCTPLFEMMLDTVDARFSSGEALTDSPEGDAKPKTVAEYFPNLPE